MAYIYLSEEKMKTYIQSLKDKGNAHQAQVNAVNTKNKNNGDDADIADHVTPAASMTEGTTVSKLSDVDPYMDRLASELKVRLDNAIAMNSSGVTIKNEDGMIAYYLPDEGAYSEDTVANVKAFNTEAEANAKQDATALDQSLKSPDGVASDGRTTEQILEEMSKSRDVPAYGASVINTFGVEGYLDLPMRLQNHYTSYSTEGGTYATHALSGKTTLDREALTSAIETLGHVTAAATYTAKPAGYDSWSEAFHMASRKPGHRGRASSLNALLAVPDAVYETDTLVDLAERMEEVPYSGDAAGSTPSQMSGWHHDNYGNFYNEGAALAGYSLDPMYGVTSAMGNNAEAARRYLVPDGSVDSNGNWDPGTKTEERWKLLKSRNWDPDVGLDGFSAAQAAVSTLRGSSDSATAAAATWSTAESIKYAVNNVSADDFTDTMKENWSVMLANSADELDTVATGSSLEGKDTKGGLAGKVTDSEFESLVYRVIDNENAVGTISAGLGEHYRKSIEAVVPEADDPALKLGEQYQAAASSMGYLDAMAEKKAGTNQEALDKAKENTSTALSVMSTVIGSGVGAVTAGTGAAVVGPLAYDVTSTIAQPMIVDEVTKDWKVPDTVAADEVRTVLQAQSYVDAARYGLLQDSTIKVAADDPRTGDNPFTDEIENDDPDTERVEKADPNNPIPADPDPFSFYSEVDGKPVINAPAVMTPAEASSYIEWHRAVTKSPVSEQVMADNDKVIGVGWNAGVENGKGADVK
ncbi:DUF6571 domain-containing protein [Actinomyces slackii]|uniref:DUF6571 domain-containing protein n=1 Tax=Actinomyces slackii TaxID=52774 RepID=A0A3S4TB85_9ACTO|nr:DUF6571 family protein [Actinomyces slackii]VEG73912.1 Uncharacterised protein [Actinomyces slackii]